MTAGPAATALEASLARIAAEDHRWHAMLALNPAARDEARAADAQAGSGNPALPLQGLILAIKDNIDVLGMATSSGCKALAGAMPRADAAVVGRLRRAGAIILGKTNLSEFSFEIRSRSSLGGDVLCPFAPHATAGGSSGGSAVAVALGYADAALGTDTGGSIRIPAACNGLVGFRPAHGTLPMAGIAPLAPSTDTVGPITRTVADAARIYRAMGGRLAVDALPRPARIGVLRAAFGDEPAIVGATEAALGQLAAAGNAIVDPFELPELEAMLAGRHIVDVEFAPAFDTYLAANFVAGTAPASLAELVEGGAFLADHADAIRTRMAADPVAASSVLASHDAFSTALRKAMAAQGIEALVYPTMRVFPEDLGNPKGGWAPEVAARTGWPAISVPAKVARDARPVGIEILAPAGQEPLLFALAAALEAR